MASQAPANTAPSPSDDGSFDRYAAFGLRLKQVFAVKTAALSKAAAANARYIAYSSDVGEAFRPVVPRWAVTATYGVAIAYVAGDVGYTGYVESQRPGGNVARATAHAALFQGAASLVGPAIIIHQAVHVAQGVAKRSGRFVRWGPTLTGLAIIPFLPVMLDEPCEHAIGFLFDKLWPVPGGETHGHGAFAHGEPGGEARPPSIAQLALRAGARSKDY